MCQGKLSGNAIDIPVSLKVAEGSFQIKAACLKRGHLDSKNRNIEIKLVLVLSLTLMILNGLHSAAHESTDKGPQPFKASITHQGIQGMNSTSVHFVFNHSSLL